MRILLVDDDELIRRVMVAGLESHASIVGVASAPAALARLQTGGFDVVLSDSELGEGVPSGHWLLGQVGRRWPAVRRVLMSATKQDTAEIFVMKPVDTASLLELLGIARPPARPA